jgi:sirohydrochlorin cobaltochelatase
VLFRSIDDVIKWVKKNNVRKAKMMPLMLVAGDHAKNDMCSDDEDSWKNILEKESIEVEIYLHGLGEEEKFQEIYIQHIKDVMNLRK